MISEIKFNSINVPPIIQKISSVFKESVKVYDCDTINEFIDVSKEKKLTVSLVADLDNKGKIRRHFFVGLLVPMYYDDPNPLVYFVKISPEQYDKVIEEVKKRLSIKDVSKKSPLWLPS